MEKLTIKEIAPYLPHDLEVLIQGTHTSSIRNLTKLGFDSNFIWNLEQGWVKILNLRLLSSLTEEMYWKLSGSDKNKSFGFRYGKYNGYSDKRDFISHSGYSEIKYFLEDGYGQFPYRMMEFFFKHHFDVFNLIPRGLALPIDGKEGEGE